MKFPTDPSADMFLAWSHFESNFQVSDPLTSLRSLRSHRNEVPKDLHLEGHEEHPASSYLAHMRTEGSEVSSRSCVLEASGSCSSRQVIQSDLDLVSVATVGWGSGSSSTSLVSSDGTDPIASAKGSKSGLCRQAPSGLHSNPHLPQEPQLPTT